MRVALMHQSIIFILLRANLSLLSCILNIGHGSCRNISTAIAVVMPYYKYKKKVAEATLKGPRVKRGF